MSKKGVKGRPMDQAALSKRIHGWELEMYILCFERGINSSDLRFARARIRIIAVQRCDFQVGSKRLRCGDKTVGEVDIGSVFEPQNLAGESDGGVGASRSAIFPRTHDAHPMSRSFDELCLVSVTVRIVEHKPSGEIGEGVVEHSGPKSARHVKVPFGVNDKRNYCVPDRLPWIVEGRECWCLERTRR